MSNLIALILWGLAPIPPATQSNAVAVRIWQFEPDGSRFPTGQRVVTTPPHAEVRLMIGNAAATAFVQRFRLDATLAIHDVGDSTIVGGVVAAGRVTGGELVAGPAESAATIHERRYRIRLAVSRGAPCWFFPFGRPAAGERGIGFEFARGDRAETSSPSARPAGSVLLTSRGLAVVVRPGPTPRRVRLEVGQPGRFGTAFEGPMWSLLPVEIAVPGSAGVAPLAVSLEARPWFTDRDGEWCVRWYWVDRRRSGGRCVAGGQPAWTQLLHGSGGQLLRVTLVEPR